MPKTRRHGRGKMLDVFEAQGLISSRTMHTYLKKNDITRVDSRDIQYWRNAGHVEEAKVSIQRREREKMEKSVAYFTEDQCKKIWYMAVLIGTQGFHIKKAAQLAEKFMQLKPNQHGIIWLEDKHLLLGIREGKDFV